MKNIEILVVDSEGDYLGLIERIFEEKGMRVHRAATGEKALELLKRLPFAVLLTDFDMPGMDGIELARRAKEITPDLHIVMLTGTFIPGIAGKADKAGIFMVLAKPFRPEEILLAVIMGLDDHAFQD